jgi:hypothetical protein
MPIPYYSPDYEIIGNGLEISCQSPTEAGKLPRVGLVLFLMKGHLP